MFLNYLSIFSFRYRIYKQKQCFIDASYQIAKGIILNDPKFHVFSFPKNKELFDVWISTIKRDNFPSTKFSRACNLFVLKKSKVN